MVVVIVVVGKKIFVLHNIKTTQTSHFESWHHDDSWHHNPTFGVFIIRITVWLYINLHCYHTTWVIWYHMLRFHSVFVFKKALFTWCCQSRQSLIVSHYCPSHESLNNMKSVRVPVLITQNQYDGIFVPCRPIHLQIFKDSFQYSSAEIWNNIPVEIEEAQSLQSFNSAYIQWFLTKNP